MSGEISGVQAPVWTYALNQGCTCMKVNVEGRRDCPDLLIFYKGVALFIECKARGERPRSTQERELRWLRKNNIEATWVDTALDGYREIDRFILHIDLHRPLV